MPTLRHHPTFHTLASHSQAQILLTLTFTVPSPMMCPWRAETTSYSCLWLPLLLLSNVWHVEKDAKNVYWMTEWIVVTTLEQCFLNFDVHVSHLETLFWRLWMRTGGCAFLLHSQDAEYCWSSDHTLSSKYLGNTLWSQRGTDKEISSPILMHLLIYLVISWSFH